MGKLTISMVTFNSYVKLQRTLWESNLSELLRQKNEDFLGFPNQLGSITRAEKKCAQKCQSKIGVSSNSGFFSKGCTFWDQLPQRLIREESGLNCLLQHLKIIHPSTGRCDFRDRDEMIFQDGLDDVFPRNLQVPNLSKKLLWVPLCLNTDTKNTPGLANEKRCL